MWNKLAWLVVAGTATFLFWHVLLNKEKESFSAISEGTPEAAIILMAACFGVTIAAWLFFRFTSGPQGSTA
jgi:hypothetical protein